MTSIMIEKKPGKFPPTAYCDRLLCLELKTVSTQGKWILRGPFQIHIRVSNRSRSHKCHKDSQIPNFFEANRQDCCLSEVTETHDV